MAAVTDVSVLLVFYNRPETFSQVFSQVRRARPALSFFPFCKEMLDRYENDTRVMMISGFNTDEVSPDVEADYFFTSVFSIWGWATWRRVADQWDSDYTFMHDAYNLRQLEALIRKRRYRPDTLSMFREHSRSGKGHFETIVQAAMLLGSGLAVVPSRNLISNVGFSSGAHHAASLQTMPRRLRRLFTMERGELTFPLRHPVHVCENTAYKERHYRLNVWGHPWIKLCYSVEELLLNLRYGRFKAIGRAITLRINGFAHFNRNFTAMHR